MTATVARPAVRALVLLAAAALATAALSLHTLGRVKDALVTRALRGEPIGASLVLESLGWEDAALALAAVVTIASVVWLQLRTRAYARLLETASPAEAFWLTAIVVAWLGHAYLGAGVLLGGDTGTHIARFLEVSRGLAEGRLAGWTNYQYAGAPLLWFTGPLTYVVGGLLTAATGDALLSAKVLLFALHLGSGLAFFALLLRLGLRPTAAMLGAILFAGAFAHLHLFLYRGVFPQAFTIVFLVLLFWAADGLLRGRGSRAWHFALFALSVAGLTVNHQPHALFAAAYLAVFGVAMLWLGAWRWRGVLLLVAAGLAGIVAAAVAVLPVLAEADWVMIEPGSALFRFRLPSAVRLLNLLVWRNTRTTWGIDYWAYLGLGTIGFGLAGAFAVLTRRLSGPLRAAGIGACLALPLAFVMYNPVVRDIIYLLFFASLLAAAGLEWLMAARVLRGTALLAAVLVVLADLASTSVQPVARNDKGFLVEAGRALERLAPPQRVLEINVSSAGALSADIGPDAGPQSYFATVQRIAGNHNMAATRLHNFLVTAAKLAEAELRASGTLSAETAALLGLFNVGRVVCHSPVANGCAAPIRTNADDPTLGKYIAIPATPILFSGQLRPFERPPGLDKPMLWAEDFDATESRARIEAIAAFMRAFLRAEGADLERRVAAALPMAGGCDPCAAGQAPPSPPGLRSYVVGLDRVEIAVELAQPGFLQLAHPWFASTAVTVNGAEVAPVRGALDLLVIPVAAGASVIALRDRLTPARRAGIWVSFGGLAITAAGAALLARRDRRLSRATP